MLFNFLSGFRTYVCASFQNRRNKLKTSACFRLAYIFLAVFFSYWVPIELLEVAVNRGSFRPLLSGAVVITRSHFLS